MRGWARRLAGCDLSVGMLRQARQRKVYDVLHKAELVDYLETQPQAFDVAISADTLCYFGDLGAAMAAARRALRPAGWLVFTVEALDADAPEPWRLQPNGRYAHARSYVEAALSGRRAGARGHRRRALAQGSRRIGARLAGDGAPRMRQGPRVTFVALPPAPLDPTIGIDTRNGEGPMPPPITLTSPLPADDLMFESMNHSAGLSMLGETQLGLLSEKPDLNARGPAGPERHASTSNLRDEGKRHFNGHRHALRHAARSAAGTSPTRRRCGRGCGS